LLITWVAPRVVKSDQLPTAWAAAGTLADGLGSARRISGDCRPAIALPPFVAGGTPLVAWLDDSSRLGFPGFELVDGGGRLHIQTPDQPQATTGAPVKLTATAPSKRQVVYFDDPVKFNVSCDRACDLRAW